MDVCISFIAGLFLIGKIKQVVYFVAVENMFVHRSHSLVAFRHSSDERNPTDVTGRSAPVAAAWAAKSRSKPGCESIPVQLYPTVKKTRTGLQQRHLKTP